MMSLAPEARTHHEIIISKTALKHSALACSVHSSLACSILPMRSMRGALFSVLEDGKLDTDTHARAKNVA
jgi:hypothetical protein